jgi:hypothetical protein
VKAGLKQRAATFVVTVLKRYFIEERDLLAHMVRFQNNVATSHDQLAEELKRLHQQVPEELRRLGQRNALQFELLAQRIAELEGEIDTLKTKASSGT